MPTLGPTPLLLLVPLAGQPGVDWVVQNHMDLDPTGEIADVTGHRFSYDGHKGTDFRIRGLAALVEGVEVLAPAAGRVKGVRDGEDDRCGSGEQAVVAPDVMCGNGLVIDHGGGWETQLCHLRRGSVRVKSGQLVQAGDVVGQVGWSGNAEFPHLHLSVRLDGEPVDPFLGLPPGPSASLWAAPSPPRADSVFWEVGFATTADLTTTALDLFGPPPTTISADAPAIVAYVYGVTNRPGDRFTLRMTSPGGREFTREEEFQGRAVALRLVGKRRLEGERLQTGTWRAEVARLRDGVVVEQRRWTVEVVDGAAPDRAAVAWEGCAATR